MECSSMARVFMESPNKDSGRRRPNQAEYNSDPRRAAILGETPGDGLVSLFLAVTLSVAKVVRSSSPTERGISAFEGPWGCNPVTAGPLKDASRFVTNHFAFVERGIPRGCYSALRNAMFARHG